MVILSLIREELSGIGEVGHRADLIQRPDYAPLCLRPISYGRREYEEFRSVLPEVDEEAIKTLTGMSQSGCPFLFPNMCVCRMLPYLHVCASSSVPVVVCVDHRGTAAPNRSLHSQILYASLPPLGFVSLYGCSESMHHE